MLKEMQEEMGSLPLREDRFDLYDYYFEVRGADFESVESKLNEIVKYLDAYDAYKGPVEPGEQRWYVLRNGGYSGDNQLPDVNCCTLELKEGKDDGIYKWHLCFSGGYHDVMNLVLTKVEMIFVECDPEFVCKKRLEDPKSIKLMAKVKKKQEKKKKREREAEEKFMEERRKLREKEEAKKERKEARQKKKNGSIY